MKTEFDETAFAKARPYKPPGTIISTVELQWLQHLWDLENLFETGVVRANEG